MDINCARALKFIFFLKSPGHLTMFLLHQITALFSLCHRNETKPTFRPWICKEQRHFNPYTYLALCARTSQRRLNVKLSPLLHSSLVLKYFIQCLPQCWDHGSSVPPRTFPWRSLASANVPRPGLPRAHLWVGKPHQSIQNFCGAFW